jgi:hypothetical protein
MTATSSYQAIPDASAAAEEAMENGGSELAPLTTRKNDDSTSHVDSLLPSSATGLMSKFSYIALGLIIGYCSSESGRRSLWNPTVQRHHRDNDEEGLSIHNGKSFSHALPFEDVFPGIQAWADTLPTVLTEESKLLSGSSSPFSSFLMGTSASSSSSTSSSSTSSNTNPSTSVTPNLLYLVHPTAVTLLYDSSRSVSEYSLDYFLLNSGGFDAQINQAYCGVVRIRLLSCSICFTMQNCCNP